MKLDKKGIKAIINLAICFNLHTLRKILPFRKIGGYKLFREHFPHQNFAELNASQKEGLLNFQKCINCGMCLRYFCPPGDYYSPQDISIFLYRDFQKAKEEHSIILKSLECLPRKNICPFGVNVDGISLFLE